MGAGKSAVGSRVALELEYSFYDLDTEIEAEQGLPVHEVFRQKGEAAFRDSELAVGQRLLMHERIVLALGGGALTHRALQSEISRQAFLVYLQATPEALYKRIHNMANRPLLKGVQEYADFLSIYTQRMEQRQPDYERSQLTINTDGLTVAEATFRIVSTLKNE